ncbi:MAG: MarR family transcriptional regulator [Ignavibacteriales bacterium]|jgi:DNA-binding transcriptional regulator GbsR (MarR family)|nr:MAG: MarR family transcriptional regulator [Ignavibacteriales bacterium]
MTSEERIKKEIIQNFGHAYRAFGLSKLMGHVVALLISSPEPLSLDEICKNLGRSKGPISQIMKRLRDRNLIRRVWHENSRKDYYEIQPEIFENAFRNNFELIKSNTRLAKQLKSLVAKEKNSNLNTLKNRLTEMHRFYQLTEKHYNNFLDEWELEREKIYSK